MSTQASKTTKASMSVKDSDAILDHLLEGRALPGHLARSRGGSILPRSKSMKEGTAEQSKAFRDSVSAEIAARMVLSPLMAINHKNKCGCGNEWFTFGGYYREAEVFVPGVGKTKGVRRLDYDPAPETVKITEWREEEHKVCVKCYGGSPVPPSHQQ